MPYRARTFDYRYINSNQIVLVDTSTFQLINHVHSLLLPLKLFHLHVHSTCACAGE